MFIPRSPRFEITSILALVHVFLACVFLPLVVSDGHSAALDDHRGSVRRVPALSFRIVEGSSHGELPAGAHPLSRRRSHHRAVNDENYISERVPIPSRRRIHSRRTNVNANHNINKNSNVYVNSYDDTQSNTFKDEVPYDSSQEINDIYRKFEYDPVVTKYEMKLYASTTFRSNIIIVLGRMLSSPDIDWTIDQFTSLNLILQALLRKHVYIFDLLPVMTKLQSADKKTQFKLVMQALMMNVPVYMQSACNFWLIEIEQNHVDFEKLTSLFDEETDFLTGIDSEMIDTCKVKVAAEELDSFDEPSELTAKTLGPVFVNIFNKMKNQEMILSQKLFVAILMNLPTGKTNPVLEEYIKYCWDVMQAGVMLPNWGTIAREIKYGSPYEIVNVVIKELTKDEGIPQVLQHALQYISLHLKEVPSTFSYEYYSDMQMLSNSNTNVEPILSMIQDDLAIPELNELKERLIVHIKEINIDDILYGMNKYAYQKPIDLLIAILLRIQGRTQNKDMRDTVLKLVSILTLKKEFDTFTVKVPAEIDLMMLLDFLNTPDSDPAISMLSTKIQNYLQDDLGLLSILQQNLISKASKSKCNRPIQCLLNAFTEILKPDISKQLAMPSNLLTTIQKLFEMIKNAIHSSAKCKPQDIITAESPEIPDDSIDVPLQPEPQFPATTSMPMIPQPSKPTEKPSMPPLIPDDHDVIHLKPPDSNLQTLEVVQIVPIHPDQNVEDSADPTLPIDKQVEYPETKPKPTFIPQPTVKPISTVIPSLIPQIIETLQPSVIPSVNPIIQPSTLIPTLPTKTPPDMIPTFSPEMPPVMIPTVPPKSPPDMITTLPPKTPPIMISTLSPETLPVMISTLPPKMPSIMTSTLAPETLPVMMPPDLLPTKNPPTQDPSNNLSAPAKNEPVLPLNLSFDQPIYIIFPKGEEPPYTLSTKPNGTSNTEICIEFPSIKQLLEGFDPETPFTPNELPEMPEISEPLEQALGPNYIEEILGKHVDKVEYPTLISLMDDVLDHALKNSKVLENPKLVLIIKRYLKAIDYISTVALCPVVIDSQKISSDVLYVTFDPNNPSANSVDSEAPGRVPTGFITLSIYHPKYWLQQVDPTNPYGTLLPSAYGDTDNPIQELLNEGLLQLILGPDFDPLLYLNRGTLLTTVLQKLIISTHVKSEPWLMKKLNAYLKSIRAVAMYSKIPEDYDIHILALQENNEVNWQPDTASLIMALPPARTEHQSNKLKLIKAFLETPNLLELLQIDKPSYTTTRGALLQMLFNAAIRGKKMVLDPKIFSALRYYEHKILTNGNGALPIVWVWVQMVIIREEVPLGQIIEAVLDYDSLPRPLKASYNEVVTYLSENPQFLEGNDNFAFDSYPTEGSFLRGLFIYFLSIPDMSAQAKYHLKNLIPYIKLTGRGAEPMNYVTIEDITDENGY